MELGELGRPLSWGSRHARTRELVVDRLDLAAQGLLLDQRRDEELRKAVECPVQRSRLHIEVEGCALLRGVRGWRQARARTGRVLAAASFAQALRP